MNDHESKMGNDLPLIKPLLFNQEIVLAQIDMARLSLEQENNLVMAKEYLKNALVRLENKN